MEKLVFICPKCFYTREELGTLEELNDMIICPLCDSPMELKGEEFKYTKTLKDDLEELFREELIDKAMQLDEVEQMKHNIKELGNNRCWEIVEEFDNPKTRIVFRQLFFQAGGVTPEKELLI